MAVTLRRNRAYLYELRGIIHNEEPFAMPDVCIVHGHIGAKLEGGVVQGMEATCK